MGLGKVGALLTGLLIGATSLGGAGAYAATIEGTWRTLDGNEISVAPCGDAYCGTLSWIVIPRDQAPVCKAMAKEEFASLILDYNNANRALQTRPLLGVEMLKLKPTRQPDAFEAKVYNAQDGKTYDVQMWVVGGQALRLGAGCLGPVCAVVQDWPRVADREVAPDFTCDGA